MSASGKVFIACSLDGFIARPDGDIEWLHRYPDIGDDYGYGSFMKTVDGLIMGRASFEKVLSFGEWPYTKPVVVLSSSLKVAALPETLDGKVNVSDKSPEAVMAEMSAQGWRAAYVDGGSVIRSFLAAGLITEMTITHIPVLLGSGIRLFGDTGADIHLTLMESRSFPTGFVQSRYLVATDPAQGRRTEVGRP